MARILALTSRVPWPPREGHQLRSYYMLDALASKHRVHLLSCARRGDEPEAPSPLRERLAGFETFPIPAEWSRTALAAALTTSLLTRKSFVAVKYAVPELAARVRRFADDCDLIHVDMLPLMAHVMRTSAARPVVLNAHNVEEALLQARIRVERRPLVRGFLRGQWPRLREFEQRACVRADAVLACSEEDAGQLRKLAPETPVHVVPNGVDLHRNRPAAGVPRKATQMVFVGQMGWFPNRDGMEWFLAEILPRIVAARPDACLLVVGKSEGLQVPSALAPYVKLAGFVPDVRRLIQESAVYVVPLRAGSGTRLKVLEAMACGKAIVTTAIGAEGIELAPGREALFADEAADFASSVLRLFDDADEVSRLGEAARQAAETRYGWDAISTSMLQIYDSLLD